MKIAVDVRATHEALLKADTLRPDDCDQLRAIFDEAEAHISDDRWAELMREYYSDYGRANRIPRDLLYMHMGILLGDRLERPRQET